MMGLDTNTLRAWLALAAQRLQAAKEYLTELDAAIGDADHGINIARGFAAAADKVATEPGDDLGVLLKQAGLTLMSAVGGASGMLYGNFFVQAANGAAGKRELSDDELLAVFRRGCDGIIQRGRAAPSDKTMVDAWGPAIDALAASLREGADLPAALAACAAAAEAGRDRTVPMQARKGRASYLGPRSVGHMDPGAASSAILLAALRDAVCNSAAPAQYLGDESV